MRKYSFLKIAIVLLLSLALLCGCTDSEFSETETQTETEYESEVEFISPEISEGTDILHKGYGENSSLVVVIDAGHQKEGMYGKEPMGPGSEQMKTQVAQGTEGRFTGIPEYELTLSVSLALRDELLRRGYTVVMVRETHEVKITNMERALLANKYAPSKDNGYTQTVNLRIHANAVENESVRGALMCTPSQSNPYPVGKLYGECLSLADSILSSYSQSSGMPIFSSGYLVTDEMTGTNFCTVPTTILEMGFMTNEQDDRLMATETFRDGAAKGIADGIEIYFGNLEDDLGGTAAAE